MAHAHMVGRILDTYHPNIRHSCHGQNKTQFEEKLEMDTHRLLHLLYRVCIHLGHSDRQHADLGGHVFHDQEAVC